MLGCGQMKEPPEATGVERRVPHLRSLLIGSAVTVGLGILVSELLVVSMSPRDAGVDSPVDVFAMRLLLYLGYGGPVAAAWVMAGIVGGRWLVTWPSLRPVRWVAAPAAAIGLTSFIVAGWLARGELKLWELSALAGAAAILGGVGGLIGFMSESRTRSRESRP